MVEACEREIKGMIRNCALCEGYAVLRDDSMYRNCKQKNSTRSE